MDYIFGTTAGNAVRDKIKTLCYAVLWFRDRQTKAQRVCCCAVGSHGAMIEGCVGCNLPRKAKPWIRALFREELKPGHPAFACLDRACEAVAALPEKKLETASPVVFAIFKDLK